MNRKFISKSNLVLRKVLNSTDNLDIIKNFIETFLSIEIVKIRLNPYLQKRADYLPAEENFGIADVRILTKEQEEYNIGIQIIDGFYVQNKLLLYYAQIHTNQLLYEENKDIYFIGNEEFLLQNNINTKNCEEFLNLYKNEAPILIYFAKNDTV